MSDGAEKLIGGLVVQGIQANDSVAEPFEGPEAIERRRIRCEFRRIENLHSTKPCLCLGAQQSDDLIGMDDANQALIVVQDGESTQIVLIK